MAEFEFRIGCTYQIDRLLPSYVQFAMLHLLINYDIIALVGWPRNPPLTSSASALDEYGNYCDKNCDFSWKAESENDGYDHTAPIGNFRASGLGLHDMSGNVWEWCWDWYGDYSSGSVEHPRGAVSGTGRVLRGGSWPSFPAYLRVAYRSDDVPSSRNRNLGFRLSRTTM